jgi:type II secretory pathway pseudopilin PulG
MHRLRERDGWTLIEILTILAIVGVMSTMAVASLRSYSRREDIRRAARSVSSLLETARSEAITTGRMTWVVFKEPTNGVAAPFVDGQYAALIRDTNNDLQPTTDDAFTPVSLPPGPSGDTYLYDPSKAPYGGVALPAMDESKDIPDGTLANTVDGTTLNVDIFLQVPAVGFNPQGFPVKVQSALDAGSGSGAVYLSDNDAAVVAVLVEPLGQIRTLVWDNATGKWK